MVQLNRDDTKFYAVLLAIVLITAIVGGGLAITTLSSQQVQLEKIKAAQAEKSERGHWLWGHFSDKFKDTPQDKPE